MLRCLAAQQNDHLANDFVYVNELLLRRTLLEEQSGPLDDFRCTRSVFDDSHGGCARFFEIRGAGSEPTQASIGIRDGGGNRLIHFVGQ